MLATDVDGVFVRAVDNRCCVVSVNGIAVDVVNNIVDVVDKIVVVGGVVVAVVVDGVVVVVVEGRNGVGFM